MAYTTRQSLLQGVLDEHEEAQKEFYNFYKPLTAHILEQFPLLSRDAVDDVHQMVMMDLFSKGSLGRYQRKKGRFRSYLCKIIRNKCYDLASKCDSEKKKQEGWGALAAREGELTTQLQLQEEKEWREFLEIKALEFLRQEVTEKQYMIFELYARQNRSVKEVCQILGVNENQVYLAKSRLTDKLAHILRQLQEESN